jgi:hypothetical protein
LAAIICPIAGVLDIINIVAKATKTLEIVQHLPGYSSERIPP